MNRDEFKELACERLAEVLAEPILASFAENREDRAFKKFLVEELQEWMDDLETETELRITSGMLDQPEILRARLRDALVITVQILMREMPGELNAWLAVLPNPTAPDRAAWVERGIWLLEQVRFDFP